MVALLGGGIRARQVAFAYGAVAMSGAAEEVLRAYTIPANTFNAVGQHIRATFWGSFAANANGKTVRVRLGGLAGAALFTSTTAAYNGRFYRVVCDLFVRAVPDSQVSSISFQTNEVVVANISDVEENSATQDDASAQDLVLTGAGVAAGDIVSQGFSVEKWEAPA